MKVSTCGTIAPQLFCQLQIRVKTPSTTHALCSAPPPSRPSLEHRSPFLLPTPRGSPKHHHPTPLVRSALKTPKKPRRCTSHMAIASLALVFVEKDLYRLYWASSVCLLVFFFVLDHLLSISEFPLSPETFTIERRRTPTALAAYAPCVDSIE